MSRIFGNGLDLHQGLVTQHDDEAGGALCLGGPWLIGWKEIFLNQGNKTQQTFLTVQYISQIIFA